MDRLTIQDNFTGICLIGSRQDLHQRALAGAVLAHEGVHFTRPDTQIDALENAYARKAFANLAYFQDRPIAPTWSSLCIGQHFLGDQVYWDEGKFLSRLLTI